MCLYLLERAKSYITTHFYLFNDVFLLASAENLDFGAVDAYFAFNEPEHALGCLPLCHRPVRGIWDKSRQTEGFHDLWHLQRPFARPGRLPLELHLRGLPLLSPAVHKLPSMPSCSSITTSCQQSLASDLGFRTPGARREVQMQHEAAWTQRALPLVLRARI